MEALGINLPGLIAQIINFALLLLLLSVLLYKPVLKMLDQRSERIRESMEKAEALRQETERSQEEIRKRLDVARQEGQTVIAQASEIGERLKREATEEARREAESLVNRARIEIQREREEAIEEVRREFADLAIMAAEKVINRSLDKATHQQLIEEVLEESPDLRRS